MYGFRTTLASFGTLPVNVRLEVLQHFVDGITAANVAWFQQNGIRPLYEHAVYCSDSVGNEWQWFDAPAVISQGCADCKALAAYRAAELQAQGIPARAVVTTRDGTLFHVVVRYGGRIEDPSAILGMKG